MSDALKKVQAGQPLAIPAGAYNAFIDAALDFRQRTAHIGQGARPAFAQAGIVMVRNDSGADRQRFEVLGVDAPIADPAAAEEAFRNRVALACAAPAAGAHEGRFVVLAEPVAAGGIARAFAAGVCAVKLDVPEGDAAWRFAEIADGVTASLKPSAAGAAAILWRAGGAGVQWAVVRLGGAAHTRVFPVELAQTGGEQGDAENPATWTYDATDPETGETLLTEVDPAVEPHRWRRPATGEVEAATYGYACWQPDGEGGMELVLGWTNELAAGGAVDISNLIRYDLASKQIQVNVGGTWTMIAGGQAVSLAEEL